MEVNQPLTESVLASRMNKLQRAIQTIKQAAQSRKKQRKDKVIANRHSQSKRQSLHQQQLSKLIKEHPPNKYRKQSLGGLVIQVPENSDLQQPQLNPYSPRSATYYVSEVIKNFRDPRSAVRQHLSTSLKILKNLQNSKMPTKSQLQKQLKILNLDRKPGLQGKKTIVFDLDETLIHCNQSITMDHDLKIYIKFPTGEIIEAGINVRPHCVELLNSLKGRYEVMIFTASHSCYANQILNSLDPTGELIQHRLYREHCHVSPQGYFVKDLRILGRPLADVLLIDNAAYSYAYQPDNGVPILNYFQGKNDFQLKALQHYLINLSLQSDLRIPNRKLFQINRYLQFFDNVDKLVEELYLN